LTATFNRHCRHPGSRGPLSRGFEAACWIAINEPAPVACEGDVDDVEQVGAGKPAAAKPLATAVVRLSRPIDLVGDGTKLSLDYLPWLAVDYAEISLLNGDVFTVEGTLDQVESKLSDAARSGQSRLAWFAERGTNASIGVNPVHVTTLRVSELSG
jgi:hypothetical protein